MRLEFSPHFTRSYVKAPLAIQRAFDKQSQLLLQDIRHPSLRAKKYDEAASKWQARVNRDWRFYFLVRGDVYHLVDINSHPK
jgi:mRNA interferase RelE/StbE